MSEWALRRFWEKVSIVEADEAYEVRLDARPVRTPGKAPLAMPTRDMAERVAEEWEAQEKTVNPLTMPWTRSANSAIDKVSVQRDEVMDHLLSYAATDLLSYRAEAPEGLVARQAEMWDPLLGWLTQRYDAALRVTSGVMPIAQDEAALQRLRQPMRPMSNFALTGFHDLVGLSGSYVIALAASERTDAPESLWDASRVDEEWQAEEWGRDEEAEEAARVKRSAFLHAYDFFHAS